ncbi:uroporphyrin-III C-methyltransferase/precorrin-2 dehydrogenase/sirohydrochlorin ferrochelatase [Sagittula marina]|uniref:Uroporphyrin-III C-methyltransferase/precorrin-2 dehydrogenase/sirohydrochlorin ferrochelatase n=1 Tax=Sagittula marina TaxID=943940 RepID=A0A7W6DKV1_9RHOB|nr:siroheme synthase CysG [Sagittula marina]MBB3985101.1 uroporphyrin-III C-methyltransferase/precorrin-2 dehydrogenase/sirohydrochlorin ferrochelatase [Sagittula marina]
MRHFPIFLALSNRVVVLSGGGDAALAKLRLLLKTEAALHVYAPDPAPEIIAWDAEGRLSLHRRPMEACDLIGAALVYAADEDDVQDARTQRLAHGAGVLLNVVDNLEDSQFITPAIVDRDPVTVAIGTEGAAPVLARAIKAHLEEHLPAGTGTLARIGQGFRKMAEKLPFGRARRDFWQDYYFNAGPRALPQGEAAVRETLGTLLDDHLTRKERAGFVAFVGSGPGDPDLLTLKARRKLDEADVVLYDRLAPKAILELARREAIMIDVGKIGFGPSTPQEHINALLVEHAQNGSQIVRLKGGDPTLFARLDEEIDALTDHGIGYEIVPGLTAASAAAAAIGQSLTKRGRNQQVRLLTAHDTDGFADHDWRTLAAPGQIAAIYMGKRAARFIQGRLLMHSAAPDTPVTVVSNASRADQHVLETSLATLSADLDRCPDGPALILYGLAPRDALPTVQHLRKQEVS